jgi:hypothetical protein
VVVCAEHGGEVAGGLPVHCQAERRDALQLGFGHGPAGVFDAVPAIVEIAIVELSVGHQQ